MNQYSNQSGNRETSRNQTMKNIASSSDPKPHVVCISYPAQGHITPMLKLAKLFHCKAGFHVSFVNTHHNHQRLLKSGAIPSTTSSNSCDSPPSAAPCFRFFSIPDGLPPPKNPDATQDIPTMSTLINSTIYQPFKDLLVSKLLHPTNSTKNQLEENKQNVNIVPPSVSLILADASMLFTLDIGKEFGIPVVLFWTASACALLGYAQYQPLINSDSSCLTNGFLDKVVDGIPSMEGIRLKNLPSFIRTTDRNERMLNILIGRVETISRFSTPLIINTFDALEHETIQSLSTFFPNSPIFPIGPFHLTLNNLSNNTNDIHQRELITSSLKSNLWKEDPACITWLDSKPPTSVIYVNFGSIMVLPPTQVEELAWGLINSEINFLWIFRPDFVSGDSSHSSILSQEFNDKVKGRGFIQSWCDQERVLEHPSIGGFLTHCGWNSTLESLCCGVPVICWPFFADQMTNCWFCCGKWGVGVEFSKEEEVTRGDVEKLVRDVVGGQKGRVIREKAEEWKRLAMYAATAPTGSSVASFDNLINQLI